MAGVTNYVLDANIYIDAFKRYYPFDLAPAFWDCLKAHAGTGRVRSIDRIKAELNRGKDDLAEWAKNTCAEAFHPTDEPEIITNFGTLMNWANAQPRYTSSAIADFANCADGWLVAYAWTKGFTVVTHETPDPGCKRRVKIPDVCQTFSVPFIDTWTMLRELGAKLG
jgi:hypothetical protein